MSNTHKTDPYWVRINRRKTVNTWHRHELIGKPYYTRRYLSDENGQPITHEEPVTYRATTLAHYESFYLSKFPQSVIKQAKELVGAGRGKERIQVGTRTVRDYEEIEHHYADHCTEGEPIGSNRIWGTDLPCTPEYPHEPSFWGGYSSRRQAVQQQMNGAERSRARKNLRNLTKAANTPEICWDPEFSDDYEESERMTDQHRHNGRWMIW